MRKQTYLIRKGARYYFRRRLPSEGRTDNGALTLSLHTSDPDEARRLARRLAVRWDEIAMLEGQKINRGYLTVAEQMAIFRAGLEEELAIAVSDLAAPRKLQSSDLGFGELFIAAYQAILLVPADADHVPAQIVDTVANGWSQKDRAALETLLEVFVRPDDIKETRIVGALQHVGAPVCENTIHEARASLLRGMIEAQRRAALFHHPLMQARGDAVAGLLDDNLVFEARRSQLPHLTYPTRQTVGEQTQALPVSEGNLFFARVTKVRFSEQVDQRVYRLERTHPAVRLRAFRHREAVTNGPRHDRMAGQGVEEGGLASYFTIAVALLHGLNRPDEDELARLYKSDPPASGASGMQQSDRGS